MYESFFGLKQKAFNLTPDPDFLYLNERTKEAFEEILYGIERREGFSVVVGDVGTGKTTLSCALLQKIERQKNIRTVLIQNPMLGELDMLRSILQDLGVRPDAAWTDRSGESGGATWTRDLTKKDLIDLLNSFLAERARENVFTVLVIDESQNLSLEMLEQLRLLSNLETTKKKLLQIIFLGQLEFDRKLAALRQLDQRVSFRFETQALSREDTEKYIRHRLAIAGGTHGIRFGQGALAAIHRHSKGYPRLINMICDRSLKEACKARSYTITRGLVNKAVVGLTRKEELLHDARSRRGKIAASLFLLVIAIVLVWLFWPDRQANSVKSGEVRDGKASPMLRTPSDPQVRPEPTPAAQVRAAPASIAATETAASGTAKYALQVYSFRTSNKAEESSRYLKQLKFPSFVAHQAGQDDAGWHVVYVGPFGDQAAAQQAGSELRAVTGSPSVLREQVPLRKD